MTEETLSNLSREERRFEPPQELAAGANLKEEAYDRARKDPDAFWAEQVIACRDRPLACWCRHDGEARTPANACHGDVILGLLEANTDDELRTLAREGAR